MGLVGRETQMAAMSGVMVSFLKSMWYLNSWGDVCSISGRKAVKMSGLRPCAA